MFLQSPISELSDSEASSPELGRPARRRSLASKRVPIAVVRGSSDEDDDDDERERSTPAHNSVSTLFLILASSSPEGQLIEIGI